MMSACTHYLALRSLVSRVTGWIHTLAVQRARLEGVQDESLRDQVPAAQAAE
jgi:hypothetical protein